MTTDELSPEDWRAMHQDAEAALLLLRQREPEATAPLERAYRESTRRLNSLTQKSLFDSLVFDLLRVLAVLSAGPVKDAVKLAADVAESSRLREQRRLERGRVWAQNWKLILGSGIAGAIIPAAFALAQLLLTGTPPTP